MYLLNPDFLDLPLKRAGCYVEKNPARAVKCLAGNSCDVYSRDPFKIASITRITHQMCRCVDCNCNVILNYLALDNRM